MSIKKIAEKAGVSPATVSRVLNNPNYKCSVSGLRDKIWKTAIEMNYVPNEAARNLKRGVSAKQEKTWYINILMTRTDSSQTDPFFSELLRVIESEIHDKNCILSKVWYMSVFSDDRKCCRENLDRLIDEMYGEVEEKRDGLIIIGRCNKEALKKLNKKYKSVVSVNRNSTNYEVDEVLCDGKKIAFNPAVELSYLSKENQQLVVKNIEGLDLTPSHAQTIRMKELSRENRLDENVIYYDGRKSESERKIVV